MTNMNETVNHPPGGRGGCQPDHQHSHPSSGYTYLPEGLISPQQRIWLGAQYTEQSSGMTLCLGRVRAKSDLPFQIRHPDLAYLPQRILRNPPQSFKTLHNPSQSNPGRPGCRTSQTGNQALCSHMLFASSAPNLNKTGLQKSPKTHWTRLNNSAKPSRTPCNNPKQPRTIFKTPRSFTASKASHILNCP